MLYNIIIFLQNSVSYDNFYPIIKLSKLLTRTKSYYFYFVILAYCDKYRLPKILIVFYTGRYINSYLKSVVKQQRPYNDYPSKIKYFKKQKQSYSFPSQSIQSIYIIYNSYKRLCSNYIIDLYFWFILILLIITRLYRGLHYLHDMLFSLILAHVLCVAAL